MKEFFFFSVGIFCLSLTIRMWFLTITVHNYSVCSECKVKKLRFGGVNE